MVTGKKQLDRKMDEKEYRSLPLLSSSDIRLFSLNKREFYKTKVLGEVKKERMSSAMLLGSVVHALLLEPQEFDSKFYLTTCNKPTALMLAFVESLFNYTLANMDEDGEITEDFGELCRLAHIDSGYKITLEQVIKKFSGSNAEDYYRELRDSVAKGLEVVTMDDLGIANRIVEIVKNDEFVGHYFQEDNDLNEIKVEGFELDGVEFKSMLDKVHAEHIDKTLQVIDLKVVFDVNNFYYEYFLKKRADIQAYVYWKALESGKADLGFDYSDYVILPPIFMAIDSGCFHSPIVYELSYQDLKMAYEGFEENNKKYIGVKTILEDLKWSQSMNLWTRSKQNYINKGITKIR